MGLAHLPGIMFPNPLGDLLVLIGEGSRLLAGDRDAIQVTQLAAAIVMKDRRQPIQQVGTASMYGLAALSAHDRL